MKFVDPFATTYEMYLYCLSEDEKFGHDFQVNYGPKDVFEMKDWFSDTPLESRSFETVKSLMEAVKDKDVTKFIELIYAIDDYSLENMKTECAYKAILTLRYLYEHTEKLIDIETEMLTSLAGNKYGAQIEQVDFSMFTEEWMQLKSLSDGDITKFDSIRKLPYESCLVDLIYRQKKSDLEEMILKSTTK